MKNQPGCEFHRGAITPIHHPLKGVKVAEYRARILGPVGSVLLVVGTPEMHGQPHFRLVDDGPEAVVHGSAGERPPYGFSAPPCAWPDLI